MKIKLSYKIETEVASNGESATYFVCCEYQDDAPWMKNNTIFKIVAVFYDREDAEFFLAHKQHEAQRNAKWLEAANQNTSTL